MRGGAVAPQAPCPSIPKGWICRTAGTHAQRAPPAAGGAGPFLDLKEHTNLGHSRLARLRGRFVYANYTRSFRIMKSVRVNLSIPGPVDRVLSQIADHTGQSKSSTIAAFLTWQMPRLRQWLRAYEGQDTGPRLSEVIKLDALAASSAQREDAAIEQEEQGRKLSRQQLRRKAQEEQKARERLAKMQVKRRPK